MSIAAYFIRYATPMSFLYAAAAPPLRFIYAITPPLRFSERQLRRLRFPPRLPHYAYDIA